MSKLSDIRLKHPSLTLFEAGELYDKRFGGIRHLAVRHAYGVFEAAWESANPLDDKRLHALSVDREEAEKKLLADIFRRLR